MIIFEYSNFTVKNLDRRNLFDKRLSGKVLSVSSLDLGISPRFGTTGMCGIPQLYQNLGETRK